MPTPATANLPIPKSYDEFEDICLEVLKLLWGDPHAARNGRSGQAQQGIDIYSLAVRKGAQCKNKMKLSASEIAKEIAAAKSFGAQVHELVFMISGPRDTGVQRSIESASIREQQAGGFSIHVLFWDDIVSLIASSPDLIRKYWGAFFSILPNTEESLEDFRRRNFGGLDDFGQLYDPNWYVLKEQDDGEELQSYDYLRLRVYSPRLQRHHFEPDDEDRFAEAIEQLYKGGVPSVVPGDGEQVLVEQGGAKERFHRRWGWSSRGCVGFVTTLADLNSPDTFPVPDLTWDLEDLLGLAGAMNGGDDCFCVLELSIDELLPGWKPSDRRVTDTIDGLRSEPIAPNRHARSTRLSGTIGARVLANSPREAAADLMVTALRKLYKVRLSKGEFVESLPRLRDEVHRAQNR